MSDHDFEDALHNDPDSIYNNLPWFAKLRWNWRVFVGRVLNAVARR